MLREVTVKIGLKQKDNEKEIVKVLLDNKMTRLVISSKFARKNKFKKKKLNRLIYIRNIDGIFNYGGLIEYTVEMELFYRVSRSQEVDLVFSHFLMLFSFLFDLFFFILFLELRVRVSDKITLSHSRSHQITWSQSHMTQGRT